MLKRRGNPLPKFYELEEFQAKVEIWATKAFEKISSPNVGANWTHQLVHRSAIWENL